MPKPLFLARSAGLFVRFLVPADLREQVGSRFLVRSLRGRRGDDARLVASVLAVALSEAFAAMRRGCALVDIKKLLDDAQRAAEDGTNRTWTASGVQIGRVNLGDVQVSGAEDTRDFVNAVQALLSHPDNKAEVAAIGQVRSGPPVLPDPASPLLQDEIEGISRISNAASSIPTPSPRASTPCGSSRR